MLTLIPQLLATLTLLSHIFIVWSVFFMIKPKLKIKDTKFCKQITSFLRNYNYQFLLGVTLTATLGSLFYSEVAKYPPCVLCWYQRILMYPQTILITIALIRNEKILTPYLSVINIVGALISGYHYSIQRLPTATSAAVCTLGGSVSCTKNYTLHYGYISIPLMALTAFVLNIIFLQVFRAKRQAVSNLRGLK